MLSTGQPRPIMIQPMPTMPAPIAETPAALALPNTLALIDDDPLYTPFLADALRERGIAVTVFTDGDEFLTSPGAFDFDFYLVDLMLPGVDGLNLVRLVRRKGWAGIIVVSGRADHEVFEDVLRAGADMHLAKPVRTEQVALAIEAVNRRIHSARAQADVWRLDAAAGVLTAPNGVKISLSETDRVVMECFLSAQGATVTRASLCERLGRDPDAEPDNILHAAIYRLRRRIEQATPVTVPLRSEAKVGYTFRGKLLAA
jgi:two-component system, OmpR family, response regulator